MKTFLSFGAGVQTTAMLILIAKGEIEADAVIFADTGAEHPETYEYIAKYDRPLCEKIGIPFITVHMHRRTINVDTGRAEFADNLRDAILLRHRIPSINTRWCTEYAKITPIRQYLDEAFKAGTFEKPAIALIGISIDEKHRAYNSDGSWKQPHHTEYQNVYPLVERRISRNDCHRIIKEYGWPDPPKSGCYFCPFQGGRQWIELYQKHPELFWDAVRLEEADPEFPDYSLYPSRKGGLRRLASGPGFGYGSLTFDDFEGQACTDPTASCML